MLLYLAKKDKNKILQKTNLIVDTKLKEEPNIFKINLDPKEFLESSLHELLQSNALFKSNYIVILNDIFEDENAKEFFFDFLDDIASVKHLFILQDSKCYLSEKELKLLKDKSFKYEIDCPKNSIQSSKNVFSIADVFLFENKKDFWLEFLELSKEFDAEQLYGILSWVFKNIFLFEENPKNLKPYLAKKYEKALKINDKKKLKSAYLDFLNLPSRARSLNLSLKDELEKWILSLNIKNN